MRVRILLFFFFLISLNSHAQLKAKGKYEKGLKTGVWEYFEGDELFRKINYSTGEILYFKPGEPKKMFVVSADGKAQKDVQSEPVFIGGKLAMYKYIYDNIRISSLNNSSKLTGKVAIAFTIDRDGKTKSHRIESGLAKEYDLEAVRLVKGIPDNWLPAIVEGKAVDCEYKLEVFFNVAH